MSIQSIQKLDKDQIISALDAILSQLLRETKGLKNEYKSRFHTLAVPGVGIKDYLKRIAKYAHCSESVYIVALILVDRLQQRNESFVLNQFCVHRLLITAVMIAAKSYDDFYYKNQYYAKVGGISQPEINQLEREFVDMISFDIFVTPELFWSYHEKVMNYFALNQ